MVGRVQWRLGRNMEKVGLEFGYFVPTTEKDSTISPIAMSDLLKTINAIFPPVLSGHLAARLGASLSNMKRVLQGAVPIMLSGLTVVATKKADAAYELCQQVQPAQADVTGILVMLGSKDAANSSMLQGSHLLQSAFGSAEQAIVDDLSQYAHLQPAQVRTLLELVGAALLGAVNGYAARHALAAEGLAAALVSLKSHVKSMLPHELEGLAEIMGLRMASRWKFNQSAAAYTIIRQATFQRGRAQWYIVAVAMVLMTGVGAATFEAVRRGRIARQAPATPAVQVADGIVKVNNQPLLAGF
jgi:hypothetical protein